MSSLRILLWWDTEDYINPESDDALLRLLQEHRKRDIPATWKMVGEKCRVLAERGRSDIIELLSDPLFDIGYHTDFHSAHPTIAEYTEDLNWHDGAAEILARETAGFEVTRNLFGKPVLCYGQPGASYTPHIYPVMKLWDIPSYVGGSVYLGLPDRPSYIIGLLNIGWLGKAQASFPAREGDKAIDIACSAVKQHIDNPPPGGLISEGNHPNEWSISQWWDVVNFTEGVNPVREEWKPAPLHEPEFADRQTALFGDYLDWLLRNDVRPVSLEELFALYTPGDFLIDPQTARQVQDEWALGKVSCYVDDKRGKSFSAAQLLYGLSLMLLDKTDTAAVPEVNPPVEKAAAEPLSVALTQEIITAGASNLAARVRSTGALPMAVDLGGNRITLEDFAVALARVLSGREDAAQPSRFIPGEMVRTYGQNVGPWPIHHTSFTGTNLGRLTRAMAWAFKPALLTD